MLFGANANTSHVSSIYHLLDTQRPVVQTFAVDVNNAPVETHPLIDDYPDLAPIPYRVWFYTVLGCLVGFGRLLQIFLGTNFTGYGRLTRIFRLNGLSSVTICTGECTLHPIRVSCMRGHRSRRFCRRAAPPTHAAVNTRTSFE